MTDTTAGEGVNEVIAALEALTKSPGTDEFDRGARAARLNALDMLWPLATAAQPSAGAQGEAVGYVTTRGRELLSEGMTATVYPKRDLFKDEQAHPLYATPAQPDTGDVAVLREAFARIAETTVKRLADPDSEQSEYNQGVRDMRDAVILNMAGWPGGLLNSAALSKPNASTHIGLTTETLAYCYALLGAARWSEAMDIWQANPEARAVAHADIQSLSKPNAPGTL